MYHAANIVAIGDRAPASPGYRKQLDYLKEYLVNNGWKTEEQTFDCETAKGKIQLVNLRARFGSNAQFNSGIKLLISCHIDTKTGIPNFVGANDGASGAALMLELARILAAEPKLAEQIELVFFDGEESFAPRMSESDGLYGSTYYVNQLQEPLPSYLINLDMVGRQGMKIRIPPDTPQVLYNVYSDAISSLKLSRTTWGVSANFIYDDHIPFVKRGIPSINIIDDFSDGNWWHTADDNLDILSADSFLQSGKVTLFMIRQLLE